jgi:hypothetical protein
MANEKILQFLPAILGFAGVAVPCFGIVYPIVFFSFGGFFSESSEFQVINFEEHPELWLFPASTAVLAVGAVLALLSVRGVVKLHKVAWLPGTIMLAGVALYIIVASALGGGEIIIAAPILAGPALGAVGGIGSIVMATKAI